MKAKEQIINELYAKYHDDIGKLVVEVWDAACDACAKSANEYGGSGYAISQSILKNKFNRDE